jgi:hypothetical protein
MGRLKKNDKQPKTHLIQSIYRIYLLDEANIAIANI